MSITFNCYNYRQRGMPKSPSKNKHDFQQNGKREHSEARNPITPKKGRLGHDVEEINFLKDELYRLKRRVKKLEDKDKEKKCEDELSKDNLMKKIEYEKNSYQAAKTLLGHLFTKEELVIQSVSGKAPNSKIPAKQKFDGKRFSIFSLVMREKFPSLETKDVTAKVQAVQKSIMRINAKKDSYIQGNNSEASGGATGK